MGIPDEKTMEGLRSILLDQAENRRWPPMAESLRHALRAWTIQFATWSRTDPVNKG